MTRATKMPRAAPVTIVPLAEVQSVAVTTVVAIFTAQWRQFLRLLLGLLTCLEI